MPPNSTGPDNQAQNVSIIQSVQLVCKPYYEFGKVSVTVNNTLASLQSIQDISPLPGAERVFISGILASDIAESYLSTFLHVSDGNIEFVDPWNDLAFLFATLQYPDSEPADFLNSTLLKEAFESSYELISTQIVSQVLVKPSHTSITGLLRTIENRLMVRTLSLRLLEGLLGFVTVLAVCLIFVLPIESILPRDPGSLLGTSLVLSRSHHALRTLRDTGSLANDAIKNRIFSIQYGTSFRNLNQHPNIQLETTTPPFYNLDAIPASMVVRKWWQPFMAGRWALSICIFVQVGVIIALELTLRLSQSHNGLADVSTDGYLPYTWSVLPAFILSSIALAYTNMAFYTKVFAPYCALKSTASPSTTFLVNYLDKAELLCLWRAARLKQLAVFSIIFAAILGSFLTITVSGVFLVQATPAQIPVNVTLTSWFNTSDIGGNRANSKANNSDG